MITQQELRGNWSQIKGRLVEKWGQLTDDDLAVAEGNVDRLVGCIQKKTGETRASIESFLDSALKNGASRFSDAAEAVRSYAAEASSGTAEQVEHAQEAVAKGLKTASDTVRRHPTESVAVCFGAGLIAGAVLGLILRNKA